MRLSVATFCQASLILRVSPENLKVPNIMGSPLASIKDIILAWIILKTDKRSSLFNHTINVKENIFFKPNCFDQIGHLWIDQKLLSHALPWPHSSPDILGLNLPPGAN